MGVDDFRTLGQGARRLALSRLNRERIEKGTTDARTGIFLTRGLRAGRQATIIATLSSITTIKEHSDQHTHTWRDRATTILRSHGVNLLQILTTTISQLGSAADAEYEMYCRTMATAKTLQSSQFQSPPVNVPIIERTICLWRTPWQPRASS